MVANVRGRWVGTTPAGVARHMNTLAVRYDNLERDALGDAALVAKRTIQGVAPNRLRNVGRTGARLGVRYRVEQTRAIVNATGPWQLIEGPTKPHEIGPKQRRSRNARRRAVSTPYGAFARVQHPGTRGKRPWRRGVAIARPLVHAKFKSSLKARTDRLIVTARRGA